MAKKPNKEVVVHKAQMLPAALLTPKRGNSNKQSRHTFADLREDIRKNGFDESILVRSLDDGTYEILSGNHRVKAGKAEGMTEFPCVIRDDWDVVEAELQSVRRNYSRGKIDKEAFTLQVNALKEKHAMDVEDIYSRMGFEDADMFADYYKQEEETVQRATNQVAIAGGSSGPQVKMVDDLGVVISSIFEQHGDTVPNSFLIFPTGGKYHMYVQTTPALRRTLDTIAEKCLKEDLDINIALGGLLSIGMSQTDFARDVAREKVANAGTEDGDSDLKPIVKYKDI